MRRLLVPLLAGCLAAAAASGATVVVNLGPYASAEEAGNAEERVDWNDADPADDTVCTEAFAALELQRCLQAMTGHTVPLVDDQVEPSDTMIVVGSPGSNAVAARLAAAVGVNDAALSELGPQGYVIKSGRLDGQVAVLVCGGSRVGTLYGAYDLLHRLGVRWFAPGPANEDVPRRGVELAGLDVRSAPAFLTRGFHAWEDRGDPDFLLWMARNRLNYWCVQQRQHALMHKLGIMMIGGGHVLTDWYLGPAKPYPYNHPQFGGDDAKPPDPYPVSAGYRGDANHDGKLSYFEAHPEWYALIGGQRSDNIHGDGGDNFCTSDPDAVAEWTKNAVTDLAEGASRDAGLMNAWMLDGGRWCECPNCKAQGTPTDRNLHVVNAYAKAIRQARAAGRINHPVTLLFLAYADVLQPPTRPLPPDFDYQACIATFFPIVRCYVHRFDDATCPANARYAKALDGWAHAPERKYTGQICIGEYYNVSQYKSLPICFMHTMATDIPYYFARGARHFHYMHCTTGNWGTKALTNWQMARQLWEPAADGEALWRDYFAGRYGPAAPAMRQFYEALERMLGNASDLKYGLAARLNTGAARLFPSSHLQYARTATTPCTGITLTEMVEAGQTCRRLLADVKRTTLPERLAARIAEDERGFVYGERTVLFYDALCRAYVAARQEQTETAHQAFAQAQTLADELKADTTSTTLASSHANAPNALVASNAGLALVQLTRLLGPADPGQVKALAPGGPALVLTGREFQGGGALLYGYGIHGYPGRVKVSDNGNYVYGRGTGADRITAWFRLAQTPAHGVTLVLFGLKCPQPPGGDVQGEVRVNDHAVFAGPVPFAERDLTRQEIAVPADTLKAGVNMLDVVNTEPKGHVGQRPWFGVDQVQLTVPGE